MRISINDDLNCTFKKYELPKDFDINDIETWEETYNRNANDIKDKEQESIEVIKELTNKYSNHKIVLTTSMGKDSQLTEYLLSKVTKNYTKIFNNTTLDCAEVYKMAKESGATIITPKMPNGENRSFYKMVDKHGTPTRFNRWCCSYFKEGATQQYYEGIDNLLFVMGMRNQESETRKDYEFEWQNEQWKNKTWVGLLPIRKWSELELWLYTIHNNLPICIEYKKGYNRAGCKIACSYATRTNHCLDKYWHKQMYERWHKILDKDFIKDEKWYRLNCTQKEYHSCWNGGLLRKEPNDEVLNEFMQYKGLEDKNIAIKYFQKTCCKCVNSKGNPTKVYHKDEIAMNLKMFGRNIEKFMCKKCLMKELNIDKEKWNELVKDFKSRGCKLF